MFLTGGVRQPANPTMSETPLLSSKILVCLSSGESFQCQSQPAILCREEINFIGNFKFHSRCKSRRIWAVCQTNTLLSIFEINIGTPIGIVTFKIKKSLQIWTNK